MAKFNDEGPFNFRPGGGGGSSSGAAGGDLGGTYPDPLVLSSNGAPFGTAAFSSPPTAAAVGWDGSNFTSSASFCPTGIETWDGTADKTIAATTSLLYTTGATPVAAARVLTLPSVAAYTVGCSVTIVDAAGIFNATNLVTPTRAGSDTIDGNTTGTTLGGAHQSVIFRVAAAASWVTTVPPSIPADTAVSNQFITAIPATGIITRAQPAISGISGQGTGVATALAVNTGSAGAFTKNNGDALSGTFTGTPTFSGTVTFSASGSLVAGANSGNVGSIKLFGNTSGDATITVPAAAGTATRFQLPSSNGSNTNVLQTDGSGNTSWVASSGSGNTIGAVVTGQVDKTDNTLANITGLSVSLEAGKTYLCHVFLPVVAPAAGGTKVAFVTPDTLSTTSFRLVETLHGGVVGGSGTTTFGSSGAVGSGTVIATGLAVTLDATIVVNAAGTLQVQGAQFTTNATTTSFFVNGYIICTKIN